ncbi:CatB-related O-acetyltransferase [Enterococcus faecium]|uniref:CatB-related O-acetyltransferase n=1 Tax=Enterococcus faecium TaxID=1352 RepID=UPI000A344553|nr:CatB-related O-acetyltransferase [Enterococcus faecium]OTN70444.1 hypothetical protein A5827_000810 [Enterococcus faecium]
MYKRQYLYSKKNNCKISSIKANLKACYGKNVIISENVVVSSDVEIGDYSYINRNSSVECCKIGNYCSISSGVYICPYEHRLDLLSTHPVACLGKERKRKKVEIGNDVLISLNSIILEGVKIGNGAVIAAGAVVTKDVNDYEIVGGVPAKHIGWRFDKNTSTNISSTRWWDNDLRDNVEKFGDFQIKNSIGKDKI